MKQYFVKLLPVEGKIKKGDLIICSYSPGTDVTHKDWQMAQGHDCCKKAKLFLCSRDIQVGDVAKQNSKYLDTTVLNETVLSLMKEDANWFKVIGEISPEAIWVREGDEFYEDELEIWGHHKEGFITEKASKECLKEDWFILDYYKIKGPCGHFH